MNVAINRIFIFISILIMSMTINSCSVFDPASPVASYLRIDSMSLATDFATEGSNSKKITDAWVFVDKKYIGTFPLPACIPVIGEGSHSISVKAGILENGILDSRAAYPKYVPFDTTNNLVQKDTFQVFPTVTYSDGLQFAQIEDFDDASLTLVSTDSTKAPLEITQLSDPNSFEGNSGKTTLDSNNTVFEVASSAAFPLPLNIPAYLELNYKCDVDFTIGVFITTLNGIEKTSVINIRSSSEWKKIYVTLSELGAVVSGGIDDKIFIHAELGSTLTTANLYFDNLKVVY